MLTRLYISNIVLIEKLNLEFGAGLNILTGETGAGKSILMDALAEFDSIDDKLKSLLDENGIEFEDALILRRTLSSDGKSRAWANDAPVSIKLLKQIGDNLVEIHGQFANHALLNPATHRESLDLFGIKNNTNYNQLLLCVNKNYQEYYNAQKRLDELRETLQKSASEREFLEHNVRELESLNVQIGEEETLATKRTAMMNAEKDAAILSDAAAELNPHGTSLESVIFSAAHILERIKTDPNPYSEQIDALYNAAQIVSDVAEKLTPTDKSKKDCSQFAPPRASIVFLRMNCLKN